MTTEQWRPVPNLDGYDVSDQGRIRSTRRGKPRMMRTGRGPCGYHVVSVQMNPRGVPARSQPIRLGSLVLAAFVGPKPDGMKVRYLNGNLLDDRLENLRYGTPEEVRADQVARARREEAAGAPTHCPKGHKYSDSYEAAYGERLCRDCERDKRAALVGVRTGVCIDCGTALRSQVKPGSPPKRCRMCAREAQREASRRYDAKRRATPRVGRCLDCGELITQTGPGAPRLRCDLHRDAPKRVTPEQGDLMPQPCRRCQTCGEVLGPGDRRTYCTPCTPVTRQQKRTTDEYEAMAGDLIGRGLASPSVRSAASRKR